MCISAIMPSIPNPSTQFVPQHRVSLITQFLERTFPSEQCVPLHSLPQHKCVHDHNVYLITQILNTQYLNTMCLLQTVRLSSQSLLHSFPQHTVSLDTVHSSAQCVPNYSVLITQFLRIAFPQYNAFLIKQSLKK